MVVTIGPFLTLNCKYRLHGHYEMKTLLKRILHCAGKTITQCIIKSGIFLFQIFISGLFFDDRQSKATAGTLPSYQPPITESRKAYFVLI